MNATDTARNLLIRQEINSFKLDVINIRFDEVLPQGIVVFDTFQNYARLSGMLTVSQGEIKDGCTVVKTNHSEKRVHVILTHELPLVLLHRSAKNRAYSDRAGSAVNRQRWTLAHEVGHVCLRHTQDSEKEEREANSFASELLIPELVILELQQRLGRGLRVDEVSRLFGVTAEAAAVRISQIRNRKFFSAYLKNEVLNKYKNLINSYIENKEIKGIICQTITV